MRRSAKVMAFVLACATVGSAQWFQPSSAPNVTVVYPPPQPIILRSSPEVVVIRERPVQEYVPTAPVGYLIAFKNSAVRLADAYWVNGGTLYYVTADHQQITAPLFSVDLGLSQLLNSERNVLFFLPAQHAKTIVHARVIRHTAALAHKRCLCTSSPSLGSGRASRASSAAIQRK
jgi:hypothetical protein